MLSGCLFSISSWTQNSYTVGNINFKGNATLSEKILKNQMNTSSVTFFQKIAFWKEKPEFSPTMIENDVERLHRFYQRQGFLNNQINYTLDRNDRKEKVTIQMEIEEGSAVKIGSVRFIPPEDSAAASVLSEIREEVPVDTGDRFVDKKILDFEAQIRELYYDQGYPFAEVEHELNVYDDQQKVAVSFHINPGTSAYFGGINIKGDSLVSEKFIRKRLKFSEGQKYSGSKLDATQARLFGTDLFRYVVVRGQKDSMNNNRIPVTIEVGEKPPWSLEAGVGYGNEDRFRASVNLTKLQFFGGARKLIVEGKHSHFLPVSLESKFIQPKMIGDKLDLIVNPFFIRENEKSYTVDRLGGGVTFQRKLSSSASGYLMYSLERDFLKDYTKTDPSVNKEKEDFIRNKSGFTLGFSENTTNKMFDPASGWKLNGHITYMGVGFRSEFHYTKTDISFIRYIPIDDDWTLAGRIRAGFINPRGEESTPIEDRFLLGGASSLRGWGRHEVSPVNSEGRPVGGNSMLESNLELRFPIYDIFSGVAFIETGNVWRKAFTYTPSKLKYDTGFGLRVKTPVGPVRLDIAAPVFEKTFSPQFFISVGHAF